VQIFEFSINLYFEFIEGYKFFIIHIFVDIFKMSSTTDHSEDMDELFDHSFVVFVDIRGTEGVLPLHSNKVGVYPH
jgi:hypothetical protein